MDFVTNLRPQTVASFAESGYRSGHWLLSSHRTTPQTIRLAQEVRESGGSLWADNGTKRLIDLALEQLQAGAREIKAEYRSLKHSLPDGRRIPESSEVPDDLRASAEMLARSVLAVVDALWDGIDDAAQTGVQLAMDPTHCIAKEDFAIGVLLALGLERELLGWPLRRYDQRNRRTIDGWRWVQSQASAGVVVYATLAAVDYWTARHAGRDAAKAGVGAVALGFAGLNKDMTYTDRCFMRRRRRLDPPGPRRYVRLVEIVSGLVDGYADEGSEMTHFHALGLGARAMFPLLRLCVGEGPVVTVDATSPLHDAINDRVLYDADRAGERVSVRDAASAVLMDASSEPLPRGLFLERAAGALGHDLAAALQWWHGEGERALGWDDLLPTAPVGSSLQTYANGTGGATAMQESFWVAHNHWVSERVARDSETNADAAVLLATAESTTKSLTVRRGLQSARAALAMAEAQRD